MTLENWRVLLDEDRRRPQGEYASGDGWVRRESIYGSTLEWSDLNGENADAVIRGQVEYARTSGRPYEWKLYHYDSPSDLALRLEAAGFEAGDKETVLVIPVSVAAKWDFDSRCDVRVCRTPEDVSDYRIVAEALFDKDYSLTTQELIDDLAAGTGLHVGFVCYDGSYPVACGRLYPSPGLNFGGLYGGGVLPSHRRRGYYLALLAARAKYAQTVGTPNLLIDALPTSRPIVESLGFTAIATSTPYMIS